MRLRLQSGPRLIRNLGFVGWLLLAAVLSRAPLAQGAEATAAIEYKVKAGYLFNFAKFVVWPTSVLPDGDQPMIIGVIDAGEAFPVIRSILEGKSIGTHPLRVKQVAADQVGKDLHMLFVTHGSGKEPQTVVRALAGASTLLVGETEGFAERGGIIGFQRENESIRLNLNLERAATAGLKISAKLSSVARLVKDTKEAE